MTMKYLTLAFALALAGCTATTSKPWIKAGASAADLQKAKAECEFEAKKSDVTVMQTTVWTELRQMELLELCMKAKGFSRES
jgi:hypothetical protein